jgi:hypothetical protein
MRRLAVVLTVFAALAFLGALWRAFFGHFLVGMSIYNLTAEGYWRGATVLLLFAIVLLMLDRSRAK